MYQYPYGNAQQLNLDWILSILQELEAGATAVNIEEVANALVSASFDAGVSYRRYDYCFYNGKLYRALNDTSGAFNPTDWLEVVIGDDIPVLTRLLNAVDASLTSLQTTVGDLDSDDIDNASLVVSGATVTAALETLNTAITNLQNAVNDLDSDDIDNASLVVSGDTVTDAIDSLNDAITRYDTRAIVDPANLTNSWLLSANGGEYEVNGTSLTGSFLEGADTSYGVLKVVFTPDPEDVGSVYGYIVYFSNNSKVYDRVFRRDETTIVWRTPLNELLSKKDDYYSKGDSVSGVWCNCFGMTLNSGKRLALQVFCPKNIGSLTFTPTRLGLYIRDVSGQLILGSNYDVTSYLYDIVKGGAGMLSIRFDKSDKWGVTGDSDGNGIVIGQLVLTGTFN